MTGFCRVCSSSFCPHVRPDLYSAKSRADYLAEIEKQILRRGYTRAPGCAAVAEAMRPK
jgi:hypothetical protein